MTAEIRPGLQSLLSYCILLTVVGLLGQYLVAPMWSATSSSRQELIQLDTRNARIQQSLASLQSVESRNRPVDIDETSPARRRFEAATPALAGAQLQALARELASSQGIVLTASSSMRPEAGDGLQTLTVNLRFRSSLANLVAFLHALESHDYALYTDNLVIQSRHRMGRTLATDAEEIEIRMDLISVMESDLGSAEQ